MDTYAEQLVVKQTNSSDQMKKFGIAAGGVLLIAVLLYVTIFIMPIAFIAAVGAAYGAYWLLKGMNIPEDHLKPPLNINQQKFRRKRKLTLTNLIRIPDILKYRNTQKMQI